MSTKVYIPNASSKHDFSSAKKFGDLVTVTNGHVSPLNTGNIHRYWEEALKESTEDDYILICSLNILCAIGSALFVAKHGKINYLIWKSRKGCYEPRSHDFRKEE